MPLKLQPPRQGTTASYYVRGSYLGVFVDRSTKTADRRLAEKIRKQWEREIEDGIFAQPGEATFLSAVVSYMAHGGERRPIQKLLDHFKEKPLRQIDQKAIDDAAIALFPDAAPATRNREVYTPVSAVLKHAGITTPLRRPKGSRGRVIRKWLWPEEAWRVIDAAYRIEPEIGLLCVMLLFDGLRITEQLAMRCNDVRLDEGFAFVPDSKNGEPQPIELTAYAIEKLREHPRGLDRGSERLFRFHKGGGLDFKLIQACCLASGVEVPKRVKRGSKWPELPAYEFEWVSWHSFRRTYATWMRRYGGLDDKDLRDTGRWKTVESASRYAQTVTSEAARKVHLLPVPGRVLPMAKDDVV